jgi:hypothetical protein
MDSMILKSLPVFDANDPCLSATGGSWRHGCSVFFAPLFENLPDHLLEEHVIFYLLPKKLNSPSHMTVTYKT